MVKKKSPFSIRSKIVVKRIFPIAFFAESIIMSTEQQNEVYHEAMRYLDNATKMLSENGKKENGFYQDTKYVRTACGTAYCGVLLATDFYLEMKGQPVVKKKGGRLSVEQYRKNLARVDRKALDYFNDAYNVLHLDGYYDGVNNAETLKTGFNAALKILERIAPRDKG